MKIPKVKQLPSGNWFCQLMVGGKKIYITEPTREKAESKAIAIKSGLVKAPRTTDKSLRQAIDDHIEERRNILSPATIRDLRFVVKRLNSVADKPLSSVRWQKVIDDLTREYSPYTVIITWGSIKGIISEYIDPPKVRLPRRIPPEPKFLRPEQIPVFVNAVKDTDFAIPALLALSSLRAGEIQALTWEDISEDSIRVHSSEVKDENGNKVVKSTKTAGSTRIVPILIPELREALKDRGTGKVTKYATNTLYRKINKVCDDLGFCRTGLHGLRHSFASLCYYLRIPAKISMQIGGWTSERTMMQIYTHISETDIVEQSKRLSEFFIRNSLEIH